MYTKLNVYTDLINSSKNWRVLVNNKYFGYKLLIHNYSIIILKMLVSKRKKINESYLVKNIYKKKKTIIILNVTYSKSLLHSSHLK